MNYEIVSNDVRRANTRAVEARSRWRKQYNQLTELIRHVKAVVRASGGTDRDALIALTALTNQASGMMMEREWIRLDLRETAYRYAPKDAVANSAMNVTLNRDETAYRSATPNGWSTLENVR